MAGGTSVKRIEYRTICKDGWGDGPWQLECDKVQWMGAAGFPCLIVRGPVGAWCGYVGVPADHPAVTKERDDLEVSVHGGLTFGPEPCMHADEAKGVCHKPEPGEPDNVHWYGFDCAHAGDWCPTSYAYGSRNPDYMQLCGPGAPTGWGTAVAYRDVAYVTQECERLAEQLKALEPQQ
jgi:hypothetical protein